MEGNARENQVWRRVQQPPQGNGGENLRILRRESMALAGIYRYLAGILGGGLGEQAAGLFRQEMEAAVTLRGLERLRGGDSGPMSPIQPSKESSFRLLQHGYERTRLLHGEYLARSVEPETGVVFRVLAENAQLRCAQIVRLLGTLA